MKVCGYNGDDDVNGGNNSDDVFSLSSCIYCLVLPVSSTGMMRVAFEITCFVYLYYV